MNENTTTLSVNWLPSDRINRWLALLALTAAVLYLLRPFPGDVLVKLSMCVLLALLALRCNWRLLAVALLFSAAGDAFLAIDGERLFVPGLASFLVTHLLYAAVFVKFMRTAPAALAGWRAIALALIPLFAIGYATVIWPKLGALALPVIVYIAAIVVMAVLSLRVKALTVPLGAILFMTSDSLIALGKFLWTAGWVGAAVWITYALAQLLISHGLLVRQPEPHNGGIAAGNARDAIQ